MGRQSLPHATQSFVLGSARDTTARKDWIMRAGCSGLGGKREGGGGEAGSGSGIASNGNDWEVALTKFFVGYLGPRPAAESAAA